MVTKKEILGTLAVGVTMLFAATHATGAPSQQTMDRCAAYAERAVQQFNLMNSTPQCRVAPSLRWQPNYDNHYNGCLILPESMANSEETIRLNHLKACGASTDTSQSNGAAGGAGNAPGQSPGPATTAQTGGIASGSPAATPGGGSPSSLLTPAPGFNDIGCKTQATSGAPPTVFGSGLATDLNGSTLTYHGSPPVTAQTADASGIAMKAVRGEYPLTTAQVVRPAYFSTCRGIPAVSALGPWVAEGTPGQQPRTIWVNVGGGLSWQQITPAAAKALLTGTVSSPAGKTTPSSPATPAKVATPAKPTH